MAIRVTRAQLRRLRELLRDGRALATKLQPQLLAAYRLTASREQFSHAKVNVKPTDAGFQITVSAPAGKIKKPVYSPTQVLQDKAQGTKSKKSRVVTIQDIAAQRPVATTAKPKAPQVSQSALQGMSSNLLGAVVSLLR